jgi:hypothetical protein
VVGGEDAGVLGGVEGAAAELTVGRLFRGKDRIFKPSR